MQASLQGDTDVDASTAKNLHARRPASTCTGRRAQVGTMASTSFGSARTTPSPRSPERSRRPQSSTSSHCTGSCETPSRWDQTMPGTAGSPALRPARARGLSSCSSGRRLGSARSCTGWWSLGCPIPPDVQFGRQASAQDKMPDTCPQLCTGPPQKKGGGKERSATEWDKGGGTWLCGCWQVQVPAQNLTQSANSSSARSAVALNWCAYDADMSMLLWPLKRNTSPKLTVSRCDTGRPPYVRVKLASPAGIGGKLTSQSCSAYGPYVATPTGPRSNLCWGRGYRFIGEWQ